VLNNKNNQLQATLKEIAYSNQTAKIINRLKCYRRFSKLMLKGTFLSLPMSKTETMSIFLKSLQLFYQNKTTLRNLMTISTMHYNKNRFLVKVTMTACKLIKNRRFVVLSLQLALTSKISRFSEDALIKVLRDLNKFTPFQTSMLRLNALS
jgi:hypothetical protein